MSFRRLLVSVTLCGMLVGTAAQAFRAVNAFTVQKTPDGNMEVLSRGGLSAANAWCAVGDYARSVLGVAPTTLIWRLSEPPRPQGASIVFSLSSQGAASTTGLNQLGGNGASMNAAAARNMCNAVSIPGRRR